MKLTIDRSKWLRGDPNSMLLRPTDGRMCCLGFLGLALPVGKGRPIMAISTRLARRSAMLLLGLTTTSTFPRKTERPGSDMA